MEYEIVDTDIHNMDETGFRISVERQQKIITRAENRRQYMADPDNRDYITSIESISAADEVHPPLLMLKSASILERWIVDELNPKTVLTYSETGYSNDEISIAWLRHFEACTKAKTKGQFRLLLLDDCSSHIEYDFVEFAQNNRIILFSFPPHTTHLLQPLDVVCFQPLKHYHAEAIDVAVRTGGTEFTKIDFLAAFEGFHKQAFKPSTILSAFQKTGIVPHDPSKVIVPLQNRIQRAQIAQTTPEPLSEEEKEEDYEEQKTPITSAELKEANDNLYNSVLTAEENYEIPPQLSAQIRKFLSGAAIRSEFCDQIEGDLRATEVAQAARKARNGPSQRTVLGGGIVTVDQCRQKVEKRAVFDEKAEIKRHEKLLQRDKKALFKQFDKAAAKARERIRLERLLKEYDQEV